ncbi:hypothetical protein CsSME_00012778 [Camellia sinensis var. sinensis]
MRMDNERLVWLNCYGVPHSLWNSKTYQKVWELWGELVVLDENITNMVSLDCGRIQICTSQLEKIDRMVLLECRGNSYPVRVVEDNNHGVGTLLAQYISQKKFSEKNSVGYNNGDDQSVVQCYGNKEDDDVVACTKAVVDTCDELAKMERCDVEKGPRAEGHACNSSSVSRVIETATAIVAHYVGGSQGGQEEDSWQ